MKSLPLADIHRALGAKFGPFAGFEMPLSYPLGVLKEHLHTRAEAGLFDISHMLHVEIDGQDAPALVARLCPCDAATQTERLARYTFFLNESGGVVDDLMATRLGARRYRIVCNAGSADKDVAHIRANIGSFDARLSVIDCAFLALQGPKAEAALKAAGLDASALTFLEAIEPRPGWFVTRSGYTGEDGFEIALPVADARTLAERLLADPAVRPIGLGARDSLRIEAGLSLYGQDLSESISPLEAGLAWAIPKHLRAGGVYIGAAATARIAAQGAKRKRVGLRPQGAAPVRAHAPVLDAAGAAMGEVTSGGYGPSVGHPVAIALVSASAAPPLFADVRSQKLPVDIVPLPFAPHRYKRA